MLGLSPLVLAGSLLAGLALGGVGWAYSRKQADVEEEIADVLADEDSVEFSPPDVRRTPMDYFHVMRHLQRQHRLAKKGYVKWYRLDSTMSRPEWVKPEKNGNGIPEYKDGDDTYFFPRESMVSDSVTGAWVALHREGEGDPVNLRDPAYPGMDVDLVHRTLNLTADSNPSSSLFGGFGNMSTQMMLYGGLALLFVLYAVYQYTMGPLG